MQPTNDIKLGKIKNKQGFSIGSQINDFPEEEIPRKAKSNRLLLILAGVATTLILINLVMPKRADSNEPKNKVSSEQLKAYGPAIEKQFETARRVELTGNTQAFKQELTRLMFMVKESKDTNDPLYKYCIERLTAKK